MYDACIIGAGIVGCAIARELAQRRLSVAVIERHTQACEETSGLNSRVIHSGFHETPGTLKAQLALEGSRKIIQYAEKRAVPILKTGMLIAIPYGSIRRGLWKEAGGLWNLWRQARHQDIQFQFAATPRSVHQIAPVRAMGGIFIPSVSVIDLEAFADKLIADAQAAGARFFFGAEIREVTTRNTTYAVAAPTVEIEAKILINSAGLRAHEISLMSGGPPYEIEFVRGDYYELIGGVARWNIRTLVYPAMPRHSRSKGIHFGPRTDGRLYIGPSATTVSQVPAKELFLQAARRFVPEILESDLQWAYTGIRPKHVTKNGQPDFQIRLDRRTPVLVNLIGIDSPGLSASMGIASHVAESVLGYR